MARRTLTASIDADVRALRLALSARSAVVTRARLHAVGCSLALVLPAGAVSPGELDAAVDAIMARLIAAGHVRQQQEGRP